MYSDEDIIAAYLAAMWQPNDDDEEKDDDYYDDDNDDIRDNSIEEEDCREEQTNTGGSSSGSSSNYQQEINFSDVADVVSTGAKLIWGGVCAISQMGLKVCEGINDLEEKAIDGIDYALNLSSDNLAMQAARGVNDFKRTAIKKLQDIMDIPI